MEFTKRNVCRAQLTKTVNSINATLEREYNLEEICVCLTKLKLAADNLRQADNELLPHLSENLEKELTKTLEYEEVAATLLTRLEFYKASLELSRTQKTTTVEVAPNMVQRRTKLERIRLMKLDGSPRSWIPFWEQFKSSVHENDELTDGERINYLRSHVSGPAAAAIEGFPTSGIFYEEALGVLKEQFGKTDDLIEEYFQSIMSLGQMKSRSDVHTLRKNYNLVTSAMRSLTILEVPQSQYSVILKNSLIKSIPTELRLAYFRQDKCRPSDNSVIDKDDSSVESKGSADKQANNLLVFLKNELDSLEKALKVDSQILKEKPHFEKLKRFQATATSLVMTEDKDNPKCFFCKQNHKTQLCDSDMNVETKKQLLKDDSRCFKCTNKNHSARMCANKYVNCRKCKKRHATTMCNPDWKANAAKPVIEEALSKAQQTIAMRDRSASSLMTNSNKNVLLQTACVYAGTNDNMQLIRLVIDGGSQLTFIKENVSRALNLPVIGQHCVSIAGFGSKNHAPARMCNRVLMKLKSQFNDTVVDAEAIEVPEICMDIQQLSKESLCDFNGLQLADQIPQNVQHIDGISVLIGADHYWSIVTGRTERLNERLVAVETRFGFALHGPVAISATNVITNLQTVLHVSVLDEDDKVEWLWNLEAIGILPETESCRLNSFTDTSIKRNGQRYEVMLPWKNENDDLGDTNYVGACVRAERLRTKLQINGKLCLYNNAIKELITSEFAETVKESETVNGVYYMPHRPVFREDKETTKIRVVFDASAHSHNGRSLNNMLEKGPNLNPDLFLTLLNFRYGNIGITADIEKAFLQIVLHESERDYHRFLWYDEQNQLKTYRMSRVTFGVTCSPFLLSAVLRKHLSSFANEIPEVITKLINSFYVDDLIISLSSSEFAKHLKNEATRILSEAGMVLRKWVTNDKALNVDNGFNKVSVHKVLGIKWFVDMDRLSVDLNALIEFVRAMRPISKRNVLQLIARVYDPLGIINPYVIKLKIIFQRIWKHKPNWDDSLPAELCDEINKWTMQLETLCEFTIPRQCLPSDSNRIELHVFSDASLQAYGVAAYMRSEDSYGTCQIALVCSKARVAPLKGSAEESLTLPKLELTAALLAARLQRFIRNSSVTINKVVCWTDSKIALHWIEGDYNRWKPYVANRVKEIQALSKEVDWRHCPGSANPADLLTRGIEAVTLVESQLWQVGPLWLKESENNWPASVQCNETDCALISTTTSSTTDPATRSSFIETTNFSDIKRLLRITAYMLRFISNCRCKESKVIGYLTAEEIEQAEISLLKDCQLQAYSAEVNSLKEKKGIDRNSKILTLNPFLDEKGIMRVGGRLQNLPVDFALKHPILLPSKAHLNVLLINSIHRRLHHGGINSVLCELRQKFWVIKARQLIKTILSRCLMCKILRGKAASQPFAPLPKDRILQGAPFQVSGIDFAGPLYFKENRQQKAYVLLFTCAVTRAVHLELVTNLNAETGILAIRRFIARRGVPTVIYSDNAKTFKRISKDLRVVSDLLNSDVLNKFNSDHRIRWKFIVERAAWWGGWWERLIKSVKSGLKASIGRNLLNREELITLLTEIEGTVNARPLTYLGNDPSELLPLTPSHFLRGPNVTTIPAIVGNTQGAVLRKQWKARVQALDTFWKRWSTEYLQQLRSAHHNVNVRECPLRINDLVLIHGHDTKRLMWKMGIVEEVFVGRDGKVRACKVRCGNGTYLRRPIQLLYPLEIQG